MVSRKQDLKSGLKLMAKLKYAPRKLGVTEKKVLRDKGFIRAGIKGWKTTKKSKNLF